MLRKNPADQGLYAFEGASWLDVLITIIVLLLRSRPSVMIALLRNFFALTNVALFLFAAVVLAWFVYTFLLRRMLRARHIANLRTKRLLEERDGEPEQDNAQSQV